MMFQRPTPEALAAFREVFHGSHNQKAHGGGGAGSGRSDVEIDIAGETAYSNFMSGGNYNQRVKNLDPSDAVAMTDMINMYGRNSGGRFVSSTGGTGDVTRARLTHVRTGNIVGVDRHGWYASNHPGTKPQSLGTAMELAGTPWAGTNIGN
jgi:hypothetical protein